MAEASPIPIVILTGLSGAGKSTALRVFEDMGFFCVDGLPASMLPRLAMLYGGQISEGSRGLVLGMDLRQRDFFSEWNNAYDELKQLYFDPQIVYIESDSRELMRRYAETRRPHPLEGQNLGLEQALAEERKLLEPIRAMSALVIDTTQYSIHDLRRQLQEKWKCMEENRHGLRVHIISFGFKHGVPKEADLVFDLRFLPNPYFDLSLRDLSGKDKRISDYIYLKPEGKEFKDRFISFMKYLIPQYAGEGRFRLTIALGCTGGRHRSVATAELLYQELQEQPFALTLEHRHIDK